MSNFDEYKKEGEPEKYEKAENWQIAIGLQAVDGLKPSEYLIELAKKNIESEMTIAEVKANLESYYVAKPKKTDDKERKDEADKVSAHITEILSEKAFTFSPAEYIGIHKRLFDGVFTHAGLTRGYNITKGEWVLDGDTVHYANAAILGNALDYDFDKERKHNYKGLSKKQMAEHITEFTINIWQIHPFCEGNTRTTAVFIIKYLRSLGFKGVSNYLFADHSWYFRNALVRAAATNVFEGVYPDRTFIDRFFGNLLLGEKHILRNRDLHINAGENATVKGKNATVKISATQNAILGLLSGNGKLTAEDIAGDIGKDLVTIKRAIKGLKDKGLLERIGSDKTGYWKVKGGDGNGIH
ncbi:MAG: Fic family protein [Christensenellaceae bacterium]|jgi:fido (protein-threonine AMPylation protein)|nr:Fic family protein [Christensenellaceae bacterium]